MILLNLKKVEVSHFPDGTQCLLNFPSFSPYCNGPRTSCELYWRYENDEEYATLMYLTMHLREHHPSIEIYLTIPYLPNARMDRVKSDEEIFTLKYFCRFINWLNFTKVRILDVHSNVSLALLDRVEEISVEPDIENVLSEVFCDTEDENCYIYFPDAGSMKRYGNLKCFKNYHILYGEKIRVWKTGEIKGLKIFNEDGDRIDNLNGEILKGKDIVMIDDIISYGGTLYHSANKLKALGANNIYAYATHVENSVLDKERGTFIKSLEDGTVQHLYTANTIFSKTHEKISII